MGGPVGGAGNEGMGGGRENAGWLELPAESVRGGGLLPSRPFCILKGPTVGVSGASEVRRNSSSSGRPCLRASMAREEDWGEYIWSGSWIAGDDRRRLYFWVRVRVARRVAGAVGRWEGLLVG